MIGATHPLEDAVAAHRAIDERRAYAKTLLIVDAKAAA